MQDWRYSFQLFFDEPSAEAVCDLIAQFRAAGLVNEAFVKASYRPHVSQVSCLVNSLNYDAFHKCCG